MKIAIVGLGQIGGSMALKLREVGVKADLFDVDPKICSLLNANCKNFDGKGYDLVVLALHIPVLLKIMNELPKDNLYLDTASVKSQVVEMAKKAGLRFIGGHPIAGNERVGPDSWDAHLFEGKPFALVEANGNSEDKKTVEEFAKLLGSNPIWTTAKEHDVSLAHTSHAPYFVSIAVKRVGKNHEKFAGPGYESMTRLSKQDPKLADVFITYNGVNTAKVLREVANEILKMANKIEAQKNENHSRD